MKLQDGKRKNIEQAVSVLKKLILGIKPGKKLEVSFKQQCENRFLVEYVNEFCFYAEPGFLVLATQSR